MRLPADLNMQLYYSYRFLDLSFDCKMAFNFWFCRKIYQAER
jgi:hypothetical protein